MKRPYGMHPSAFSAYISSCYLAKVDPNRVMQCIGTARASASTHLADGVFQAITGAAESYCAAVDIRTHDLNREQVEHLLDCLFSHGFYGWWRHDGSWADNQHAHIVYTGVPMKRSLRDQFHDFCHDLDGLVSHQPYDGPHATEEQKHLLRMAFFSHNATKN